ncbi:hypothetical protein TNCV_1034051 [Trichonephila clavipes]|nr:hypothetical protein TNCV_1034051 [Trichonephila clavipes]
MQRRSFWRGRLSTCISFGTEGLEHVLSSIIHFPSWSATATVPPKLSRADQEAALTAAGHRSLTLGQSPVDLLTTGAE